MHTVKNMRKAGLLVVVRTRRVEYCNKPVAEYAPRPPEPETEEDADALDLAIRSWVR